MSASEGDTTQIAESAPVTRVVTHAGRRTSVRLEPVFWDRLGRMARRQGVRVGTLIGRIAEAHAGRNLTAHLRATCLVDAERDLAAARMAADPGGVSRLIHWAPTPALLLGPETHILYQNPALDTWLDGPAITGLRLAEAFRVRTRRPFRDLWQAMQADGRPISGMGLLRISEGRVSAAEATVVPAGTRAGPEEVAAVIWISTRGSRARGDGAPEGQPSTNTSVVSGG